MKCGFDGIELALEPTELMSESAVRSRLEPIDLI